MTAAATVSAVIVTAAAFYLVGLGAAALLRPAVARRFLTGFASTRQLHVLELAIRVVVGIAFIAIAPQVMFSFAIRAVGWILLTTSVALAMIPWKMHQRFAAWAVPQATRFMPLIGVPSLLAGGGLIAIIVEAYAR